MVLQAKTDASKAMAFLTYGSPLRHLFAHFFPAYFNEDSLGRIGTLLSAAPAGKIVTPAQWPWRNLYRPSDPIGGRVLEWSVTAPAAPRSGTWLDTTSGIDQQLRDPAELVKPAGDACYPVIRGHSDYFADPAFDKTVQDFRNGTTP